METFWIILAIIIAVACIVGAVNKNTRVKIALAEQEREDKINSPEYQAQMKASMDYFQHLEDTIDYKKQIVWAKTRLFSLPKFNLITQNEKTGEYLKKHYYITHDKTVYAEAKQNDSDIRLVSKKEFIESLKQDVKSLEKSLKDLNREYEKQKEKSAYKPENIHIIRRKYGLNDQWYSEHGELTSIWQFYEERSKALHEAQVTLRLLENPDTRQQTLDKIQLEQKKSSDNVKIG